MAILPANCSLDPSLLALGAEAIDPQTGVLCLSHSAMFRPNCLDLPDRGECPL